MASGLLIIDKAGGWTSHDVVAKLRGILKERRVGHGGTLDPMATGVLVVFVGRATRAVEYLPGEKTYIAQFRVGGETDTQDSTGTLLRTSPVIPPEDEIKAVLSRFRGELEQVPPMVSAVKIGGQRLYKMARQGIEVERQPRPVTIHCIEWRGRVQPDTYEIKVTCSAGTYIRTLVHDIGSELGCGAYMTALRRIASGPFSINDAVAVEDASWDRLLPLDMLFQELPKLRVADEAERKLRNGAPINMDAPDGNMRVYAENGEFLLLGCCLDGKLSVIKSFYEV